MFDIEGKRAVSQGENEAPVEQQPFAKAAWLAELKVDTLICGAVSRPLAELIAARGIRLIPFVAGEKEEVLAAFLTNNLFDRRLMMPGCRCGRMRFRGGRAGYGRGRWMR